MKTKAVLVALAALLALAWLRAEKRAAAAEAWARSVEQEAALQLAEAADQLGGGR